MQIAPRTLWCANAWRLHAGVAGPRFDELQELCDRAGDKTSPAIAMTGLLAEGLGSGADTGGIAARRGALGADRVHRRSDVDGGSRRRDDRGQSRDGRDPGSAEVVGHCHRLGPRRSGHEGTMSSGRHWPPRMQPAASRDGASRVPAGATTWNGRSSWPAAAIRGRERLSCSTPSAPASRAGVYAVDDAALPRNR